MNKFIILCSLFMASSAFAGPIEDAVQKVEIEKNARCAQVSRTIFSKCIGNPATCFYSIKYKCLSADKDFDLKVKVRENYLETVVTKIVIKTAK